jgi:hypothetical protein
MNAMRYRAILKDPDKDFERPQQTFSQSRAAIDEWATLNFRKLGPKAFVEIYETSEQLIAAVQSPKWKETPVKLS